MGTLPSIIFFAISAHMQKVAGLFVLLLFLSGCTFQREQIAQDPLAEAYAQFLILSSRYNAQTIELSSFRNELNAVRDHESFHLLYKKFSDRKEEFDRNFNEFEIFLETNQPTLVHKITNFKEWQLSVGGWKKELLLLETEFASSSFNRVSPPPSVNSPLSRVKKMHFIFDVTTTNIHVTRYAVGFFYPDFIPKEAKNISLKINGTPTKYSLGTKGIRYNLLKGGYVDYLVQDFLQIPFFYDGNAFDQNVFLSYDLPLNLNYIEGNLKNCEKFTCLVMAPITPVFAEQKSYEFRPVAVSILGKPNSSLESDQNGFLFGLTAGKLSSKCIFQYPQNDRERMSRFFDGLNKACEKTNTLATLLGKPVDGNFFIFLIPSKFSFPSQDLIPSELGFVFFSENSIIFLKEDAPLETTIKNNRRVPGVANLILHELVHAVIGKANQKLLDNGSPWFSEGLAEYYSYKVFGYSYEYYFEGIESVEDMRTNWGGSTDISSYYTFANFSIAQFAKKYGLDSLRKVLSLASLTDNDLETILQISTNDSTLTLDSVAHPPIEYR